MSSSRAALAVVGSLTLVGILAACGGSGTKAAAPTTAQPTTSASTAPPSTPATTAATTPPTAPPPTSFGQGVVGLVVTGAGSTLVPPQAPTVLPYNPNCQVLLDAGFTAECVVVTAPTGTIAALVETQQSAGTGSSSVMERDVVWSKVGATWRLALRRYSTGTSSEGRVEQSDVARDGDPKAVFVTPAPNAQFGNELDVVEANGTVTLVRQLHGGFAAIDAKGGLDTFTPSATPASGYDEAIVGYAQGAWRITADTQVSQTQAQAEGQQPFTDPQGVQGTFLSADG